MMNETIRRLRVELAKSPILCAASSPTNEEIDQASQELNVPFASDYREFLIMFGGAMVGPYPVFGLRPVEVMGNEWSVVNVTARYRNDGVPGCDDWVVLSEDHSGNPVGMDSKGTIWIHDHDFGGITPLAEDFEEHILVRCLSFNTI